jgi:hypothetical protein
MSGDFEIRIEAFELKDGQKWPNCGYLVSSQCKPDILINTQHGEFNLKHTEHSKLIERKYIAQHLPLLLFTLTERHMLVSERVCDGLVESCQVVGRAIAATTARGARHDVKMGIESRERRKGAKGRMDRKYDMKN